MQGFPFFTQFFPYLRYFWNSMQKTKRICSYNHETCAIHLVPAEMLDLWGFSRFSRFSRFSCSPLNWWWNMMKHWLGLRMPEIPCQRTSIWKNFIGEDAAGPHSRDPPSAVHISKTLYLPQKYINLICWLIFSRKYLKIVWALKSFAVIFKDFSHHLENSFSYYLIG